MKIKRLELTNFTVFEHLECDFASGVNVFIGENGTGKTHVLKLLYAVSEAVRHSLLPQRNGTQEVDPQKLQLKLREYLGETFQPHPHPETGDPAVSRLVRRSVGPSEAIVQVDFAEGAAVGLLISRSATDARERVQITRIEGNFSTLRQGVFLPTREILSIYPGFGAANRNRELSFDRTYLDLSDALASAPLKLGRRPAGLRSLQDGIQKLLGGRVSLESDHFYLWRGADKIEAPLAAEGHRKLGTLMYLIGNGSISSGGTLFWDEPEANINPTLAHFVAGLLWRVAAEDVQVFTATHDYLLLSEFSLLAEYPRGTAQDIQILSLFHSEQRGTVELQSGKVMADISHNPLLDAYSDHYDREMDLSSRD